MKNLLAKLTPNLVGSSAAAVAFLILPASSILAQRGGQPNAPQPSTNNPSIDRMREMKEREAMLRSIEMRARASGEPAPKSPANEIFPQIKQDFERIQIIRNELVDDLSADKTPGYKRLSEATAEIKKRASRLKTLLALHDAEGGEKRQKDQVELNTGQIKDALVMLCDRIFSFTTNPIFNSPGVVDINESAKANRDLQSIIDLSSGIRKSAERLGKANK